jgi:hypothetical protein
MLALAVSIIERRSADRDVAAGRSDRAAGWARYERWLAVLFPFALITVLAFPLLVDDSAFNADWPVHLWLLRHQGWSVVHELRPSLFVHSDDGVFYPNFAFYGGTLYALGGPLASALGGAGRNGYVLCWLVTIGAGYGGWVWLGRIAGLGRWTAQMPAVVFVTSPYYLTLIYDRGDWPELVAIASLPVLVASALAVLDAESLKPLPTLALVASTIAFTGSHNQTLLWGGTLLLLAAVVVCVGSARARRSLAMRRRGLLRVAGLVGPALLVNAWFLLPDIVYAGRTFIASPSAYDVWRSTVAHTADRLPAPLFTLHRGGQGGLDAALPLLAMAWALAVAVLTFRRAWRTSAMQALSLLAAMTVALVVLITHGELVVHLPKPYVLIQYTYRLENYVLLTVAGGVLVALVLLREAPRRLRELSWAMLVVVVTVSIIGAIGQVGPRPGGGVVSAFWHPTIDGLGNFAGFDGREWPRAQRLHVTFPPTSVAHDRVTATVRGRPGQLVDTNLVSLPALIRIEGAHVAGYHAIGAGDRVRLRTVLRIDAAATPDVARITVSAAHPWPVTAGRLLSLLGVLGLAANVVPRRRRFAQRPPASISSIR